MHFRTFVGVVSPPIEGGESRVLKKECDSGRKDWMKHVTKVDGLVNQHASVLRQQADHNDQQQQAVTIICGSSLRPPSARGEDDDSGV